MLAGIVLVCIFFAAVTAGFGIFVFLGGLVDKARLPLALGAWGAAVMLGLVAATVGYTAVQKKYTDVRRGWNLVPVVVAAVDIPADTEITFDMISQRSVPEQFVTSSVVKPDSAHALVGQKTIGPMQAGDPITWVMIGHGLSPTACQRGKPEGR